jgi:hypothetical protein
LHQKPFELSRLVYCTSISYFSVVGINHCWQVYERVIMQSKGLILLVLLLGLSGCEKSMNISDEALSAHIEECLINDNLSPGMAVACGNYQKECQRRGKATGNYFC